MAARLRPAWDLECPDQLPRDARISAIAVSSYLNRSLSSIEGKRSDSRRRFKLINR
jgi:hypothetical protein